MRSSRPRGLSIAQAEPTPPPNDDARGGPVPTQIVHFEIPADDTGKAREFWGSLFGWQFQEFPGPSEYHMTEITDRTGGAITNAEPGKQGTRAYFDVDEINASAARVKEL